MDPRRLRLTCAPGRAPALAGGLAAALSACAAVDRDPPMLSIAEAPAPPPAAAAAPEAEATVPPAPAPSMSLSDVREPVSLGREALAAANVEARAQSRSSAFIGGLQVFDWAPGRVYEIWTAPLRVTTLTLPPGETVTGMAAGDTVRWQIAESASGDGRTAAGRTHILIKPLETGLETNLVLTTSHRIYLLHLRSGRAADGFNTAVAWDAPLDPVVHPDAVAPGLSHTMAASPVGPEGPVHAGYRIEPRGRTPSWTPVSVFDDGVRTFVVLPEAARRAETPVLFVLSAGGEAELVNYRQIESLIIVDRLFERAELRRGDRRPEVVRLIRREADR